MRRRVFPTDEKAACRECRRGLLTRSTRVGGGVGGGGGGCLKQTMIYRTCVPASDVHSQRVSCAPPPFSLSMPVGGISETRAVCRYGDDVSRNSIRGTQRGRSPRIVTGYDGAACNRWTDGRNGRNRKFRVLLIRFFPVTGTR